MVRIQAGLHAGPPQCRRPKMTRWSRPGAALRSRRSKHFTSPATRASSRRRSTWRGSLLERRSSWCVSRSTCQSCRARRRKSRRQRCVGQAGAAVYSAASHTGEHERQQLQQQQQQSWSWSRGTQQWWHQAALAQQQEEQQQPTAAAAATAYVLAVAADAASATLWSWSRLRSWLRLRWPEQQLQEKAAEAATMNKQPAVTESPCCVHHRPARRWHS